MPATNPLAPETSLRQLKALGEQIRARRKSLGVSATVAAEAAGVSRVTLHRIEKGEASVTIGAWTNVLAALGLEMSARTADEPPVAAGPADLEGWLPVRVPLADYPQLKALAWQVHGADTLTPVEAADIYERNARHIDQQTLTAKERALLAALQAALGKPNV